MRIDRGISQSTSLEQWEKYLPSALLQQLQYRGFNSSESISRLLSFSLTNLQDPLDISGMSQAAERLFLAYQRRETVLVYGDYDMDGSSGIAMMKIALDELGYAEVLTCHADRHREGYGFHAHILDREEFVKVSLIVTVDVGITAFEACRRAKARAIDVIITDHHLAQSEERLDAYVVVNPNQPGDKSKLKFLCGTGVAFYLLRTLKRVFQKNQVPHEACDLRESLTFVLLATLTDMVPLVEDNRILVRHGLDQILKTRSPAIKSLLRMLLPYKSHLSSSDIAIQFAPKLNALTRMESKLKPATFMMIKSQSEAQTQSKKIIEINSERADQQHRAESLAEKVEKKVDEDFFFFSAPDLHVGVLGLVATKMCQKHGVPAFVATRNLNGFYFGSARAPEAFEDSLVDVLQSCSNSLEKFGGHSHAAGFQYSYDKENDFVLDLQKVFRNKLRVDDSNLNFQSKIEKKRFPELRPSELSFELMKWIEMFEPFGKNFEAFQFYFRDWSVDNVSWIKKRHLKLKIRPFEGQERAITAWYFSANEKMHNFFLDNSRFSFHAEVQQNEFKGSLDLQLIIREVFPFQ